MKRTRLSVVACLTGALIGVSALLAPSALAQEVDYTDTVTVAAGAQVEMDADVATITFGTRAQHRDAAAATSRVADETAAVVDALRTAGVAQGDLTVGGVRLDRRTDRRGNFLSYVASVSIKVKTEALDRLGAYIGAAVSAGASSIRNLSYDVKDRRAAVHQALTEAMQFARAKAESLAAAEGRQVGPAIVISEYDSRPPRAVAVRGVDRDAAGSGSAASVIPLEPPTITTRARITVTFALV